jgi:hypothetical protein
MRATQDELELGWVEYEEDDILGRVQYQGQWRQRSRAGLGCMEGKGGALYEGHWLNNQVPQSHHQHSAGCPSSSYNSPSPTTSSVPPLTFPRPFASGLASRLQADCNAEPQP